MANFNILYLGEPGDVINELDDGTVVSTSDLSVALINAFRRIEHLELTLQAMERAANERESS